MVGNVWEWTRNAFPPYPFAVQPADGAEEAEAAALRVVRGGSWNNTGHNARCAVRNHNAPYNMNNFLRRWHAGCVRTTFCAQLEMLSVSPSGLAPDEALKRDGPACPWLRRLGSGRILHRPVPWVEQHLLERAAFLHAPPAGLRGEKQCRPR
jgi:hypothetical protein